MTTLSKLINKLSNHSSDMKITIPDDNKQEGEMQRARRQEGTWAT
jgi:hypothetical protein